MLGRPPTTTPLAQQGVNPPDHAPALEEFEMLVPASSFCRNVPPSRRRAIP